MPRDLAGRLDEPGTLEYLNRLNREIQGRMEAGGDAFVSNAVLDDVYALRMCVVNFRSTFADVERLGGITVELGRAVDRELRSVAEREKAGGSEGTGGSTPGRGAFVEPELGAVRPNEAVRWPDIASAEPTLQAASVGA